MATRIKCNLAIQKHLLDFSNYYTEMLIPNMEIQTIIARVCAQKRNGQRKLWYSSGKEFRYYSLHFPFLENNLPNWEYRLKVSYAYGWMGLN